MSAYNPYASGHGQQPDAMQQIDMSTNGRIMPQASPLNAMAGHSLDDIVSQNATLMRRQSMPQGFHSGQQQQQQQQQQSQQTQPMDTDDPRRMSMMEFTGTSPTGPLESYQFSLPNSEMVDATAYMAASQANPAMQSRQASSGGPDMVIDNGFAPTSSYMPMMPSTSSFQSPAHLSNMDMDLNSPYINTPMHMSSLGYNSPSIDRPVPMYSHNSYHGMMASPHHTSVPSHMYAQTSDASGNTNPPKRPTLENSHSRSSNSQTMQTTHHQSRQPTPQRQNSRQPPQNQRSNSGFKAQPQHPVPGSRQDVGMDRGRNLDAEAGKTPDPSKYNPNNQGFNWPTPEGLSNPQCSRTDLKLTPPQVDGHLR
jgi:hypothetical protein